MRDVAERSQRASQTQGAPRRAIGTRGRARTAARRRAEATYAVDSSVAVAALDGAHVAHEECREVVRRLRPALSGHAAFEVHAVLTRMPGSLRVDAPTATSLISRVFPQVLWLGEAQAADLLGRLGQLDIRGGAVYDALVGEAARVNRCILLSRDLRAARTYERLGVEFEMVGI